MKFNIGNSSTWIVVFYTELSGFLQFFFSCRVKEMVFPNDHILPLTSCSLMHTFGSPTPQLDVYLSETFTLEHCIILFTHVIST